VASVKSAAAFVTDERGLGRYARNHAGYLSAKDLKAALFLRAICTALESLRTEAERLGIRRTLTLLGTPASSLSHFVRLTYLANKEVHPSPCYYAR
jgi:hypothetical protein